MASARIKTTEKENARERERERMAELRRKWERENASTIDKE